MAERALPPPVPEQASAALAAPRQLRAPPDQTYVVKVQKDQIYRVPPPENAYLAERYRAERAGGGKSGGGSSCSTTLLLTLGLAAAAVLLLGASVWLSVVVMRPAPPSFSVNRLSARNASAQRHAEVDYDFFLTAINPNKVTALWYKDGGTARLLHQGTALAKAADVGTPEDGGVDAKDFNVLLHGGGHATPKAVEKALRGSKKEAVALELAVEFPVQVHVGALAFAAKRLAVACEIRTAGLGKHVHISSQKCRSSFGK
ncbi:hypothetical protein CFC21_059026 [Triticum aestivum]|uniref:Late embryogenesis abundant protein LEA-2 subgroup domain-containing protein n=2 Tax=Triticum aestivum TaxID=4565 RepID=A0A3B6IVS1_WHEAT|nr:NDR1/HIN1-like protein 13 [Triticum aestivum]KAF7050700.1 hypothetical protein CFC21_059026 [Triticum aestivum]